MTIEIEQALATLSDRAPASILPEVLRRVGLADEFVRVDSPVGAVFLAWGERGLTMCHLASDADAFAAAAHERLGRDVVEVESLPGRLAPAIAAIERGEPIDPDLVDWSSVSPFQRDVLRLTASIPAGEVLTYGQVAERIGRPRAVRAVGTALARNPVPVVVPCHRVVRSDGTIGQYAFGTERKRALLTHEGVDLEQLPRRLAG